MVVNHYVMGEGDTLENYNRVAETVGGLSLRKKDNMIQAIVVVGGKQPFAL